MSTFYIPLMNIGLSHFPPTVPIQESTLAIISLGYPDQVASFFWSNLCDDVGIYCLHYWNIKLVSTLVGMSPQRYGIFLQNVQCGQVSQRKGFSSNFAASKVQNAAYCVMAYSRSIWVAVYAVINMEVLPSYSTACYFWREQGIYLRRHLTENNITIVEITKKVLFQ